MKTLVLGVHLAAALAWATMAAAQSAPMVGQLEVGDEPITLRVGETEGLAYFVTARTRSGHLISAPKLIFASLDPSVVEIRGDSALGLQPGSALVVVKPERGSRPVQDTLRLAVVEAAGYVPSAPGDSAPAPDTAPPPRGGASPAPAGPPPAQPAAADESLARLPPGTVLSPEPNPLPLLYSEREAIKAVVRKQGDNSVVGTVRATWESLSPAIVRVDSDGNVTGVGVGTGVIQVTPAGGAARTVSVTVATLPITFVRHQVAIPVGEQRSSMVVVPRQGNRALDNLKLNWSSNNDSVAMVGADGTVTGRSPGRALIVASGSLGADTLRVVVHAAVENLSIPKRDRPVVVPLRGTIAHRVIPMGAQSDTLRDVPISWVVEDTSVVGLDSAAQTLTGKKVGTTKLTVQVEGFDPSSWTVTVIPPGIALAPDRLALSRKERQTLVANMMDNAGRSVAPLTKGQWRSSDPAVVAVSPSGQIQGGKLGRALVSVSGPGERGDTSEILVVGDLLVSSGPEKRPRLYQLSLAHPDSLVPVAPDSGHYLSAAYSPDRTRIAIASVRERRLTLSVMAAAGDDSPRTVLRTAGSRPALAWMPDGQHLVFAGGDKRRMTLGLLDVRTASWDTLTVVEDELSPSVSTDGTIVYARGDKNRSDLYTLKPPSKAVTRLTNTPYYKSDPRWLPDGEILYLMEDEREKARYQIVRFDPKSRKQVVVTRSQEPILAFSVARDGRSMAYTIKERNKRKPPSLFIGPTEPGGRVRTVPLRAGETVSSLSY